MGVQSQGANDIPLGLVMHACPEIREVGRIRSDADLIEAATAACRQLGISPPAWNDARDALGDYQAAAALALILSKHTAGLVSNPGGYLRGMTSKARIGELHLARSFHGLSDRS
jgi:replication initiation protein RepC